MCKVSAEIFELSAKSTKNYLRNAQTAAEKKFSG